MDEKINPETAETAIDTTSECACGNDCTCQPTCECKEDIVETSCDCGCDDEDEGAEIPVAAKVTEKPKREPRPAIEITDDHLRQATETLAAVIGFLGLSGEVKAQNKDNKIVLAVNSTDAGRIIGRKGQNLEAIQFLLARILVKGEQAFPRIVIDIDGYARNGGVFKEGHERRPRNNNERRPRNDRGGKERRPNDRGPKGAKGAKGPRREFVSQERESTLRQQALDYAKEVVKWGEPITLPPMSAIERRIIHIALEETNDVKTESIGQGARKSVVISQK